MTEQKLQTSNGKAVVPPLSEDYTDKDGNAAVNEYAVTVEDTKDKDCKCLYYRLRTVR